MSFFCYTQKPKFDTSAVLYKNNSSQNSFLLIAVIIQSTLIRCLLKVGSLDGSSYSYPCNTYELNRTVS